MKKFIKTFLAANLSLFIALSLVIAPVQESNSPIAPTNHLSGQKGETN